LETEVVVLSNKDTKLARAELPYFKSTKKLVGIHWMGL